MNFMLGFFLLFFVPNIAGAVTVPLSAPTSVFLDEAQMQRKASIVSPQGLSLEIQANTFAESAWVKIKSVTDEVDRPLPNGWTLLSGPVVYDIRVKQPQPLSQPLRLSFPFEEESSDGIKRIAFWDRNQNSWRFLPSTSDGKTAIQAKSPFPYSIVALLQNLNQTEAPIKIDEDAGPSLDAQSAIVIDDRTGSVLFEKSADTVAPIASLTKLMTAMVFFDHFPGWKKTITYEASDDRIGARLRISPGETFTVKDAFYVTLVGSANNTAIALSRSTGLSSDEFVDAMNTKVQDLGLTQTSFVDPSGIEVGNVSTARELAKIAQTAFKDFRMLQGTTAPSYHFETLNLKRPHHIKNTSKFLPTEFRITGAKTGYLDEALYCQILKVKNEDGNEVIVVLLGNPSSQDRFQETKDLASWAFNHYRWNRDGALTD